MEKENNNNLKIYNQIKSVPDSAQKKITGGRLNGMTDIKPMWRIEMLTTLFGPCGIGWYTKTINKEIIEGANNEKIAIVDILLFVKINNEWSEGIEGSGGSSFIANEKNGLYTSDECFKMAYTDALSVACKSLGMGADVYWGDSKYNTTNKKDSNDLTVEDAQNYIFDFGKYKGKKLTDIGDDYIDYLVDKGIHEEVVFMWNLLNNSNHKKDESTVTLLEKKRLELEDLIIKTKSDRDLILSTYKVDSMNLLSEKQLDQAIKKLSTKVKMADANELPF